MVKLWFLLKFVYKLLNEKVSTMKLNAKKRKKYNWRFFNSIYWKYLYINSTNRNKSTRDLNLNQQDQEDFSNLIHLYNYNWWITVRASKLGSI